MYTGCHARGGPVRFYFLLPFLGEILPLLFTRSETRYVDAMRLRANAPVELYVLFCAKAAVYAFNSSIPHDSIFGVLEYY